MSGLWVLSPWYGLLEIVGEPGASYGGTECWDGTDISVFMTETLQPLTPEAASMLRLEWPVAMWSMIDIRRWELTASFKPDMPF